MEQDGVRFLTSAATSAGVGMPVRRKVTGTWRMHAMDESLRLAREGKADTLVRLPLRLNRKHIIQGQGEFIVSESGFGVPDNSSRLKWICPSPGWRYFG